MSTEEANIKPKGRAAARPARDVDSFISRPQRLAAELVEARERCGLLIIAVVVDEYSVGQGLPG